MKLRVKDIVKIWNNGAASLVAGQKRTHAQDRGI